MKKLSWHTETRIVSELVPNIKNPRTMSPKQIEDLKKSLQKFNLVEIPVIDTNNKVIAGHQRLMVLKLLGREQESIEVRVPNRKLSNQEYDQYLLSSNRIHGDWDWDILARDFDIEMLSVSGFDDFDLSKVFDVHKETTDDKFDVEKEIKKAQNTKIKTGDIYQLGRHRLICGDSTDQNVVSILMDKQKAHMVNDDVPFNINLSYESGVAGKKNQKDYGGTINDNKSDIEYTTFIRSLISNAKSVLHKDAHVLFWCDERYVWLFQTLYKELEINSKRLLIWIKNNSSPTPQSAFNKVTEFVVYGTLGSPYINPDIQDLNEIQNKETTTGNNLLHEISNLILAKRLPAKEYLHPTQKSPMVHEKVLKRCTKANDVVLDLTAGSGSILVACEQLGRTAYVCELEPVFCQVIINRFKQVSPHENVKKIN
jgi:DNA modification methylase